MAKNASFKYIKFNKTYRIMKDDLSGEIVFAGGKIYKMQDTPGTVARWIKRGCEEVAAHKDALDDPRFPVEKKAAKLKPVEKPVEEKPEIEK